MITKKQQRGFIFAVRAGEIMMKSGGEIYRVEDMISRICHACDIPHVEIFATANGIFASIGSGGENGDIKTYIKTIRNISIDLSKISKINALSRDFVSGKTDVEDAIKEAERIDATKPYSLPIRFLCSAGAAFSFCLLFGGDIIEAVCSGAIGILACFIANVLNKYDTNYFIVDFICVAVASLLALISTSFGITENYNPIIIGVLMLFVPGTALTNSLRDFINGDMQSGMLRLCEALAVAVALAAGAGFMLGLWPVIGGAL